ncbi:MAG: hypothetical protein DRP50_02550, partial [Thermotoga sp.]
GTISYTWQNREDGLLHLDAELRYALGGSTFVVGKAEYDKLSDEDITKNNPGSEVYKHEVYEYDYPSYRSSSHDLLDLSGTFYQDLGFLKIGIGGRYYRYHSPYSYKKTINGTETTYELSYTSYDPSYTSWDLDTIDQSYDVHGDFYLPSLGLWGKDVKYFQDTWIREEYITPTATMEPVNYEEYFKPSEYRARDDKTGYSGKVGIDLSLGTGDTILTPYVYFDNSKGSYESYVHRFSGDKSASDITYEIKDITPGATMYMRSLDVVMDGSYKMYNENYVEWSTDSTGTPVTFDASGAVYSGYKVDRKVMYLSVRKRFPFDSFYVIPGLSYARDEYAKRGTAYDRDNKELTGDKYEYYGARDETTTTYSIFLNVRKDFGNDMKFGADIGGAYRNYDRKTYSTSDSTVTYTENSSNGFYLLWPHSRLFVNMRLLKHLFISVSGSFNLDSSTSYPEKLKSSDEYTSTGEITSSGWTQVDLAVKLKYEF